MKIAIHHSTGSFSERWITYCEENDITYKTVDCYQTDIINQIRDCDILMWHHHHGSYKDVLFAKQLLNSVEQSGKKVFPDFYTGWHFDDKLGQKYLLEAINAPAVPSYVFFTKKEALNWVKSTTFPKVFKLRGGAGSTNVRLIKSKASAEKIINVAFGRGFSQFDRVGNIKDRFNKFRNGRDSFLGILKAIRRLFISTEFAKMSNREKGYFYVQEFIPENSSDLRIIVIGDRAFAIKRFVREGDFRASGSGRLEYLNDQSIDKKSLKIAFEMAKKIKSQCIAFDFIYNQNKDPLIVEISFGFAMEAYDLCEGYWDYNLQWFKGKFNPQGWIIKNMIA